MLHRLQLGRLVLGRLVLGRLLALLLISLGVVVIGSSPAMACSCAQLTLAQQVAKAQTVFSGTLQEVTSAGAGTTLTYRVQADRVFKGELDRDEVTFASAANPGSCGLGELPIGKRYAFFLEGPVSSDAGAELARASSCGGTRPLAKGDFEQKFTAVVGKGVAAPNAKPDPFELETTVVDQDALLPLGRMVAPGAALALVGVLGLLLAGFLSRLRSERD